MDIISRFEREGPGSTPGRGSVVQGEVLMVRRLFWKQERASSTLASLIAHRGEGLLVSRLCRKQESVGSTPASSTADGNGPVVQRFRTSP